MDITDRTTCHQDHQWSPSRPGLARPVSLSSATARLWSVPDGPRGRTRCAYSALPRRTSAGAGQRASAGRAGAPDIRQGHGPAAGQPVDEPRTTPSGTRPNLSEGELS